MNAVRGNLSHYRLQLLVPALFEGHAWSGIIRMERGPVRRTFVVDQGVLRAESSTVPGEHLCQLLADRKLLDMGRSAEAFNEARKAGLRLGSFLVREGYLAEAALLEALEHKARESFFDCYEWESGEFELQPSAPRDRQEGGLELNLKLQSLHREALARRREWRAFWDSFDSAPTELELLGPVTTDELPPEDAAMLRCVAQFRRVADVLQAWPEGRLAAARRLLLLYRRGALRPSGGSPKASGASVGELIELARGLLRQGQSERAAEIAVQVLERSAVPEAHQLFREAEASTAKRIEAELERWRGKLEIRSMPRPVPPALTVDELYLHSRLQEGADVKELLRSAPMGELAAYRSLRKLLEAKALVLRESTAGEATA